MNTSVRASQEESAKPAPLLTARRPLSVCVPGLTARLRALGISYVRMEYAGAGGRGDFIHMEYLRADGTGLRHADPTVHSTALQAIFRYLLTTRHSNWAERDGSTGDFRWDLSTDSLIHTHYIRGPNGNERIAHHDL
jgi:hypothetical protein